MRQGSDKREIAGQVFDMWLEKVVQKNWYVQEDTQLHKNNSTNKLPN